MCDMAEAYKQNKKYSIAIICLLSVSYQKAKIVIMIESINYDFTLSCNKTYIQLKIAAIAIKNKCMSQILY